MTAEERYWNGRTLAETKAALASFDAHVAAVHVELATRCLRKALAAMEPGAGASRVRLEALGNCADTDSASALDA